MGISHTAVRLAQAPVLLAGHPHYGPLLPPDAAALNAALLEAAGLLPRWRRRLLASSMARRAVGWTETWTMRGVRAHLALRKRWLHDQALAALGAGASQVLILGAGLDSLGLRLARAHPEARVFELDMPPTAAAKERALALVGRPRNLRVVSADLATRPLPDVLEELPWDPTARALVVAEGLLMYLPEAAVRSLFRDLRAASGPRSHVLFTHLEGDAQQRPGGLDRLTTWSLRAIGEPLRWGIAPPRLGGFLGELGYRLVAAPDHATLCATYGLPPTLVEIGEHLAAAETSPN